MPTLKQLVDGAIKAGSKFAFPKSEATIVPAQNGKWHYTMPFDGYFCAALWYASLIMVGNESVASDGSYSSGSTTKFEYLDGRHWVAAKKGDRIFIWSELADGKTAFGGNCVAIRAQGSS